MTHQATVSRGLTRFAFDVGVALADLVESAHRNISRAPGIMGTPHQDGLTTGLTGLIYQGVKSAIRFAGGGVDAVLAQLGPMLGDAEPSRRRDAVLSALNGVVGDHLVATGSPLAIPMQLRVNGMPLQLKRRALATEISRPSGRVAILVHGLCLNERHWYRKGHDHGTALARDLGYTPLYLHYNTGLHISTNGRAFSEMLDVLVKQWPVPIEELTIIGHSMGGLVARSACHYGREAAQIWRPRLRNLIFLGTPHHGVPLERGGQWVHRLTGKSAYTAPFTRLGRIRSAGITDLRYGNVVDEDWEGHDRFNHAGDTRQVVPLPPDVRCHAIAGTANRVGGAIIGDVQAYGASKSRSGTGGSNTTTTSQLELSQKIATLADLTTQQLRTEWRRLYRNHPPRLSRDLLVRTIAYRMQELAYGGLSKATQRRLTALTKELQTSGGIAPDPGPRVRPGARLVREWRGRAHTVVVTEDGFEFSGKTYSSLSKIAQAITGAHWSGPRFFGLNRSEAAGAQFEIPASAAVGEGEESNG